MEDYDEFDHCEECRIYGNDYRLDDDGEWVSACDTCWLNPYRDDGWDD